MSQKTNAELCFQDGFSHSDGFFKDARIENKDVSFLFNMTVMHILQMFSSN